MRDDWISGHTFALTSDTGVTAETYDSNPYGNTLIFNAPGTGSNWWADDARQVEDALCENIFQGLNWDSEAKLIQNRMRGLNPAIGRFLQRDPLLYIDGPNAQAAGHIVMQSLDPAGLQRGRGRGVNRGNTSNLLLYASDIILGTDHRMMQRHSHLHGKNPTYGAAWEAYYERVWDGVDGTSRGLSFGKFGLGHTFNQQDSDSSACYASCIADNLINYYNPIGYDINVVQHANGFDSLVPNFEVSSIAPSLPNILSGVLEFPFFGRSIANSYMSKRSRQRYYLWNYGRFSMPVARPFNLIQLL